MDTLTFALVGAAYGTTLAAGVSGRAWRVRSRADGLLALLLSCGVVAILAIALEHRLAGGPPAGLLERIEHVATLASGPVLWLYVQAALGRGRSGPLSEGGPGAPRARRRPGGDTPPALWGPQRHPRRGPHPLPGPLPRGGRQPAAPGPRARDLHHRGDRREERLRLAFRLLLRLPARDRHHAGAFPVHDVSRRPLRLVLTRLPPPWRRSTPCGARILRRAL